MIKPGMVIDGKYQVWEKIGRGGMGTVYKAQHLSLDRPVAIKFLHPEYAREDAHKARFVREAKVSSRLHHENAITIHDFGEIDGHLYIVMELLNGKPLHHIVGRGRALDRDRALTLSWQVADVLVGAHDMSLVHRDLKPENIMIEKRPDGTERAVVVDFGLAFLAESDQESLSRMTQEGIVAGTPAFLSPEQAQGRTLLPSSDIYSFGCVMYEMFTGHTVFLGREAIALLNQHIFVTPPAPREAYPDANVPVAIDTLIMDMLEKDPEDRPTAIEVRDWLGKVLGNETVRDRGRPEALLAPRKDRSVTHAPSDDTERLTPLSGAPLVTPAGSRVGIVIDELPGDWIVSLGTAKFGCSEISLDEAATFRVVVIDDATEEQVAQVAKQTTVIALTDNHDISTMTGLMKAGAFDVLAKPFDLSDLVKKVERAWRNSQRI